MCVERFQEALCLALTEEDVISMFFSQVDLAISQADCLAFPKGGLQLLSLRLTLCVLQQLCDFTRVYVLCVCVVVHRQQVSLH